jgi:hypothetical protein
MTALYLDSEFNGHGGELISLALAAPDGHHWYGYWGQPAPIDSWVEEHVLPYITVGHRPCNLSPTSVRAIADRTVFRASLRDYLRSRSNPVIYADWPDDFAHLMRLMSGPSFDQSWMVPCSMVLIDTPPGEPKPEIPHNAMSDAIALMQWYEKLVTAA